MADDEHDEPEDQGAGDAEPEDQGRPRPATVSASEAARRCGVARSTIQRHLAAGDLPNAQRDMDDPRQPWRIPIPDLLAAGLSPSRPADDQDDQPDAGQVEPPPEPPDVAELRARAAQAEARAEAEARRADMAEQHVEWLQRLVERSLPAPDHPLPDPAAETSSEGPPSDGDGRARTWWLAGALVLSLLALTAAVVLVLAA